MPTPFSGAACMIEVAVTDCMPCVVGSQWAAGACTVACWRLASTMGRKPGRSCFAFGTTCRCLVYSAVLGCCNHMVSVAQNWHTCVGCPTARIPPVCHCHLLGANWCCCYGSARHSQPCRLQVAAARCIVCPAISVVNSRY
jgi:hypothetical protein